MVTIKSLKRIVEADTAHDIKYKSDIESAKKAYGKVEDESRTWLGSKPLHWSLSRNKKLAEAAKDKDMAIDAADARRKAAKQGMASTQDLDDARFEAAKAKAAAVRKSSEATSDVDKSEFLKKISPIEHPLPYVAAAAGLVGLAALQKRKNRLPEPGRY